MHRTAVKELDAKKKQTEQVGGKLDDLQELIEEKRAAIKGVEGQLKKIRLERQKVEEDIQRDQETAEVTRQKIETQFRQPADQVVKQMKEEAAKAQAAQRVRRPGLRPQGGRHGRASQLLRRLGAKARGGRRGVAPAPKARLGGQGAPVLAARPQRRTASAAHGLSWACGRGAPP